MACLGKVILVLAVWSFIVCAICRRPKGRGSVVERGDPIEPDKPYWERG